METDVIEAVEVKWAPPVIYDLMLDRFRAVTQADVDHLVRVEHAYNHAVQTSKAVADAADILRKTRVL